MSENAAPEILSREDWMKAEAWATAGGSLSRKDDALICRAFIAQRDRIAELEAERNRNEAAAEADNELIAERDIQIHRITESRDAISALFPDDAPHKHAETGVSLLDDVRDLIADRKRITTERDEARIAGATALESAWGELAALRTRLDEAERDTKFWRGKFSQLADAEIADTKRLDWLESEPAANEPVAIFHPPGDLVEWRIGNGDVFPALRQAIDAAMAKEQPSGNTGELPQSVCKTCRGRGEVADYVGLEMRCVAAPCPDCSATQPATESEVEELKPAHNTKGGV